MKERIVRVFLRILEAIPLPALAAFCEAIMLLVCAINRKHRRIARINLRNAFPEMEDVEADRIIRECCRQLGTYAAFSSSRWTSPGPATICGIRTACVTPRASSSLMD
jgi:lauroyl/myristoyl acyltransferase